MQNSIFSTLISPFAHQEVSSSTSYEDSQLKLFNEKLDSSVTESSSFSSQYQPQNYDYLYKEASKLTLNAKKPEVEAVQVS